MLTDPVFLNKGEFDELAGTLQEEKVFFRVLCIPFYSVAYLNRVLFREIMLFLCENLLFFIILLQFGH
ncbi:membrane-associated protein [Psychroflexus torquis ATCC 700755]|uniref:Membrane-associated protein n=1 Tax=Psychroflexus torquis (strain ATCC 700755 / CIP 106069 / ACAM 623) TaxID=313595 RepID=K4IKP8_PSYTT|nr:membrane-associated protein [Psychroflexus torquis ATCC 700755]